MWNFELNFNSLRWVHEKQMNGLHRWGTAIYKLEELEAKSKIFFIFIHQEKDQ